MKVKVKITNDYSDGHHSETEVDIDAPDSLRAHDLDDWFQDRVFPHTGDGHGIDFDGGSCYTATIIDARNPVLVGAEHEWVD